MGLSLMKIYPSRFSLRALQAAHVFLQAKANEHPAGMLVEFDGHLAWAWKTNGLMKLAMVNNSGQDEERVIAAEEFQLEENHAATSFPARVR